MSKDKKENTSGWIEIIKTFLWALILASIFRTFAYDPYHIPSASMYPNLLIGDYVIVSKYSYGYSKYSFWPIPVDIIDGRILDKEPKMGDIAVFRVPQNAANKQVYIKRIIGLPGDKIQMVNSRLKINGEFVEHKEIGYANIGDRDFKLYREKLPNGALIDTFDEDYGFRLDNTEEFLVPEGKYFMMGDNRDNSDDSRADLGFVDKEHLIGRAEIILFSSKGMIWDFTSWRNRFFIDLRI